MDIALHRRDHNRALLPRAALLLHLGLEIGNRSFHYSGSVEHRGQLHFARAEQVANRFHAIEQYRVDQLERCVLLQSFLK